MKQKTNTQTKEKIKPRAEDTIKLELNSYPSLIFSYILKNLLQEKVKILIKRQFGMV